MFLPTASTPSGRPRDLHHPVQDRQDRHHESDPYAGGRRGVPPGALHHHHLAAQPGHHAGQEETRPGHCTVSDNSHLLGCVHCSPSTESFSMPCFSLLVLRSLYALYFCARTAANCLPKGMQPKLLTVETKNQKLYFIFILNGTKFSSID